MLGSPCTFWSPKLLSWYHIVGSAWCIGSHDVASFGGFFDFLEGFVDHGKLHLGDEELPVGHGGFFKFWV